MSLAAVVMTVEALVLALVVLFLVALLRSHAEILRRLMSLEGSAPGGYPRAISPATDDPAEAAAQDVVGHTPQGDAIKVALGAGSPDTLLAFLSSGCASCGSIWGALRAGGRGPAGTRLVAVTKGSEAESPSRLLELTSPDVDTVMSSQAWEDFSVPSTPHFVLVNGQSGVIAGRGSAASWEQLVTLVEQARADSAHGARGDQSSSARARRAEEALAGAGITAGHPSLYPSTAARPEEPLSEAAQG